MGLLANDLTYNIWKPLSGVVDTYPLHSTMYKVIHYSLYASHMRDYRRLRCYATTQTTQTLWQQPHHKGTAGTRTSNIISCVQDCACAQSA